MPVTSWGPPAVLPRLCCRLLRCDGADGSSRGVDGVALGGALRRVHFGMHFVVHFECVLRSSSTAIFVFA